MPDIVGDTSSQPSRRSFAGRVVLASIAAATAGLFALRGYFHSRPTPGLEIPGADEIPVGGSAIFQYPTPNDPCIIIRTGESAYIAYSRICTHTACPVSYQPAENALICPCHGGVYSVADGSVLQGPPPRPLPRIQLEFRGATLVAVGVIRS